MSLSKMALLAAGLALGLSTMGVTTTAFAQSQNKPGDMLSDVGEDEAIYLNSVGKVTKAKTKMTAAHHTKASAGGARELSRGALVYKKGGKLYLLENKPAAAAGKTTVQEGFQDMFDGNHQY